MKTRRIGRVVIAARVIRRPLAATLDQSVTLHILLVYLSSDEKYT